MKKIFARRQYDLDSLGNTHSNSGAHTNAHHSSLIGRNLHIGHFPVVVDDIIAEGGFGTVFRVRSQQGQYYALKRTCVNNERSLAACRKEITIVSSLSHKNIIHYVDSAINPISEDVSEVLLLTVYYPGSLCQMLRERQRLTEAEVLRVFCDLCEAVCRMHHCKTPLIHRDLKVENILIDNRHNFVLCDFGSATSRVLHPAVHGFTRCQDEIQKYTTQAYRAPEMLNLHASVPLGPQIDIWAMGCVLYCLCFNVLPFGDNPLAIQSANYSLPDNSQYSERLHKLIGCLLCVEAANRPDIYQTCALAFSLVGLPNPAQNLNNLPALCWNDIPTPLRESEKKSAKSSSTLRDPHQPSLTRSNPVTQANVNQVKKPPVTTTVAPRQRPKAGSSNLGYSAISDGGGTADSGAQAMLLVPPPPVARSSSRRNTDTSCGTVSTAAPIASSTESIQGHSVTAGSPTNQKSFWPVDFTDESHDLQEPIGVDSNPLKPHRLSAQAFAPYRAGHQRTFSADVGYMSRLDSANPNDVNSRNPFSPFRKKAPSIEPSCTDVPFDQGGATAWVPFSSQLRQSQSLFTLPVPVATTSCVVVNNTFIEPWPSSFQPPTLSARPVNPLMMNSARPQHRFTSQVSSKCLQENINPSL